MKTQRISVVATLLALVPLLALLPLAGIAGGSEPLKEQALEAAPRGDPVPSTCISSEVNPRTSSPRKTTKKRDLPRELFNAIDVGNAKRVSELLKKGVSVNVTNERGMTPLLFLFSMTPYRGSRQARIEITQLLLLHGADPNGLIPPSVNESGAPVLDWAIYASRSTEVVRLFLKHGADPNIQGAYALFTAVLIGEKEIVELLIDNGANVNARGRSGQTPLFLVDKLSVAETLVRRGADLNAKNDDGISVLTHLADPYKGCGKLGCIPVNEEIVRYLESKGAR